jgi:hypothetical protein
VCIKGDPWVDVPSNNFSELTKLRENWQGGRVSAASLETLSHRTDLGTIYTGVTEDEFISYLRMWGDDGASLYIAPITEGDGWSGSGTSDFAL